MNLFLDACLSRFKDPQVASLFFVLAMGSLVMLFFGAALAPYFTALVVAYLLEGMIRHLQRIYFPRALAVTLVFGLFLFVLFFLLFVLLPNLAMELTRISDEVPRITEILKQLLQRLNESAAGFINPEFAESVILSLVEGSKKLTSQSIRLLLQSVPGLVSVVIYLFLVPFLVFFFMKDKERLLAAFCRYLPQDRTLLDKVLREVNAGVGGYVRGKFWELLLLGGSSYAAFTLIGFKYAFVVGLLTGLSVLIPFLGLAVVTLPVIVLGVFQWGLTWEAANPLIVYSVLQMIDGNIVAPLILGEAVKVHPTTIMLAVLLFGYFWGVLGVFFAVPLAVLVKSVLETLLPLQMPQEPAV